MSQLHAQSRWFLDQIAAVGRAPWHEMAPAEARELFASMKGSFGSGPNLHLVEDQTIEAVGAEPALKIRIYRPSSTENSPVMMYFHGGGWVLGNLDTHDSLCRRLADATQTVVVAVNYRLAPEAKYPAAFQDAFRATRYVADKAADLGLNARRLSVAGDSAGGNLAAAVALHTRDVDGPKIHKQVLIYPVIEPNYETSSYVDFAEGYGLTRETMRWFWHHYTDFEAVSDPASKQNYANLANSDTSNLPPALVLTAEFDVLRDEGELFAKRMEESGSEVTLKRYPGMLHGFLHYGAIFDDAAIATSDIAAWLKES